jgi:hypothetical protein
MEGGKERWRRILDRDLFLFILDLEVKRARRYQNFLCLLFPTLQPASQNDNEAGFQTCYQILVNLLMDEMRETDLLGSLGENSLVILVPYADISAGDCVKSRFEGVLKYFDFRSKGFEVIINRTCFPTNGTDTLDLIKRPLEI